MFPKIGVSQNGWFIMENPIKNGWFGGATIFGNTQIEIKWATSATSPKLIFEIDDLACNAYFRAPAEAAAQRYLRSEWVSKSRRGVVDRAGLTRDFWGWCWKVFVKMSRKRNFWSTEKFCTAKETFRRSKRFFFDEDEWQKLFSERKTLMHLNA